MPFIFNLLKCIIWSVKTARWVSLERCYLPWWQLGISPGKISKISTAHLITIQQMQNIQVVLFSWMMYATKTPKSQPRNSVSFILKHLPELETKRVVFFMIQFSIIPTYVSITGDFLVAACFLQLKRGNPISLGIQKIVFWILKDSFVFQYLDLTSPSDQICSRPCEKDTGRPSTVRRNCNTSLVNSTIFRHKHKP